MSNLNIYRREGGLEAALSNVALAPECDVLKLDWYREALPSPIRFGVFLSATDLTFAFFIPDLNPSVVNIDDTADKVELYRDPPFVEGLWQHDVAEIFIGTVPGGPYYEFNLAPSGAWWGCRFSSYRERDSALDCGHVVTARFRGAAGLGVSNHSGPGWCGGISIPLLLLTPDIEVTEGVPANVSFIYGNPRRYVASAVAAGEPDYHRVETFARISMQP